MAGISFGGLASGLDSEAIIEQLMGLERRPVALLEQRLADLTKTRDAVGTIGTKLASLRAAVAPLGSPGGVLVRQATSTDAAVLGVSAGTGATPGTYTISVLHPARPSVATSSVLLAGTTGPISTVDGVLRFQVGTGPVQSVAVSPTTTLDDLVAAIGGLAAGVTASAVNLGTASSPSYTLRIATTATGSDQTITILQDDTAIGITTAQAGDDAVFTVDELGTTYQRSTNTVDDVLPGVTLVVRGPGTAVVTVADDADAVVARVQTLVSTYNDLRTFIAGESAVSTDADAGLTIGSLAADATADRVVRGLQQAITSAVSGTTGAFVNLSGLGVTTARDGTLTLDETRLRAALTADPDGVAEVVSGASACTTTLIDGLTQTGGVLPLHADALARQSQALEASIAAGERQLQGVEASLRRQFDALETLLADLARQSSALDALTGATQAGSAS
ncbi:MAG TPA: flagellar filament capping protein FliD [Candidatus Eisenbacteria bacterium]|nr:flagellar filament capping protein FliD [Candidatus Eisenbacteria bacterium]